MRQEQTQTSFRAEAAVRKAFDEMNGTGDGVRAPYHAVSEWLGTQPLDGLKQKLLEAETMFRRTGITFAVYGSEEAAERPGVHRPLDAEVEHAGALAEDRAEGAEGERRRDREHPRQHADPRDIHA